jgi:hypothetical protein
MYDAPLKVRLIYRHTRSLAENNLEQLTEENEKLNKEKDTVQQLNAKPTQEK